MGDVPNNTMTAFDLTGKREDLSDEISIITPIDSPFYHDIGVADQCTAVKHEFMTDVIRQPGANKAKYGSDPTIGTSQQPTKLYNIIQLQEESFSIDDTSNAVKTAGNSGSYEYQQALKIKALVGDFEYAFLREVRVDGSASTAPSMRGLLNWQTTNLDKADDATLNADGTVTGGTPRDLSKEMVKGVLQDIFTAGGGGQGKVLTAYCGAIQKTKFDKFYDRDFDRREVAKDAAVDKVDLYITSFGTVKAQVHRTMPADVFTILDLAFWKKATLVPVGSAELATTSRSNKKYHMTAQHTLEAKNEATSGRLTDLSIV
ncbi:MAG: DUF5309 family protein [Desulfuromonadaceae bacterium]|nr:DUF5309 family protein [Desulfuromonadaceae bacterium]